MSDYEAVPGSESGPRDVQGMPPLASSEPHPSPVTGTGRDESSSRQGTMMDITVFEGLTLELDGTTVEPQVERPCFASVMRDYPRFVMNVLGWFGVASTDVEDVGQDVFYAIHKQLHRFEGRAHVKTWIFGICRKKALSYLRRKKRRERIMAVFRGSLGESDVEVEDPHDVLLHKQGKALMREGLAKLTEKQALVFVLHAVEGMRMEEVAEKVGCPLQTAWSCYRTARLVVEAFCRRRL